MKPIVSVDRSLVRAAPQRLEALLAGVLIEEARDLGEDFLGSGAQGSKLYWACDMPS
jgi:hypothetical protein